MTKTCRCGVNIEIVEGPNGKGIPLKKITHAYQIIDGRAVPIANMYQSHFLDCPHAKEFSRRNA